jgi:hypothetical protein
MTTLVLVVTRSEKRFQEEAREKFGREGFLSRQYGSVLWKVGDFEYKYVRDAHAMRGYQGVRVEFWPGADEREDYDELAQAAKWVRKLL